MYKIGIDVGGMSIKAGLVVNGEIIQRSVKETNQSGGLENIIEDITELVNDLLDKSELEINNIDSIGIGFPGVVTSEGRVTCVNIGLENALIIPKLEERLKGTIVRAGNDANVAALAEIGHTMVATNYYDCNCGNNGCFETFCSATAIIKYTQKLLKEGRETIIRDMCNNNLENITAKMVFDAYKEGDQVAVEIINRFKKYLAMGIGNIVNFIDPAVISIGGGVSNASDILLDGLSEQVKKHLPFKKAKIGDIVIAKFKNDAGIIGASAL